MPPAPDALSMAFRVTVTFELFQPAAFGDGARLAFVTGGVVSMTVTVKVWLADVGESSSLVAVHVTVVVSMGNVDPDAGAQLTEGATGSPDSSTALGEA